MNIYKRVSWLFCDIRWGGSEFSWVMEAHGIIITWILNKFQKRVEQTFTLEDAYNNFVTTFSSRYTVYYDTCMFLLTEYISIYADDK